MKKILKPTIILFCLLFTLSLPSYFVFAGSGALNKLENVGTAGGYAEADEHTIAETAGQIVGVFLGFLGIIFIILTIYGGFRYMTARGNDEQAKEALKIIRYAIVGLVIVVGSYAIYKVISVIF